MKALWTEWDMPLVSACNLLHNLNKISDTWWGFELMGALSMHTPRPQQRVDGKRMPLISIESTVA